MLKRNLPTPFRFLRLGWRGARRVPGVWLLRGGFEFAAYLYRFLFAFGFGLLFVVHFATFAEAGLPLPLYPTLLFETIARPGTMAALLGLATVGWAVLFAAESFVYAGMWSALREATVNRSTRPWTSAFTGAFASFGQAVSVRLLVRLCDATLFVTLMGILLTTGWIAARVGAWTDSALLAPAMTWAAILTVVSVALVVVRLTTEFVAAAVFVDDVGLGEGILRAAQTTLRNPLYLYRLFIVSAAVLIPPLLAGWLAALLQNVLFAVDATALASVFRLGAELAIVVGLVMFSVMMHATFFAYYAWSTQRLEAFGVSSDHPKLTELLPTSYKNVANVDEILGPWDDAPKPSLELPPPRRADGHDLSAILLPQEEE